MHLLFNVVLFFIILNLNWFGDKIKGRPNNRSFADIAIIPILLGVVLTVVDNLRFFFIYKILIFIILSIIIYISVGKIKQYGAK